MLPGICCVSALWWIHLHAKGAWNSLVLSWEDVRVNSHSQPKYLVLLLQHSKMDMFGTVVSLFVGATGCNLCPVAAVLSYLAARPSTLGPLFVHQDGRPLSRARMVSAVRSTLASVGVDTSRYIGHSFRIGAATTAAQAGLQDLLIQTLGWWKSSAFLSYIHTPPSQLLAVSAQLLHWGCTSFSRVFSFPFLWLSLLSVLLLLLLFYLALWSVILSFLWSQFLVIYLFNGFGRCCAPLEDGPIIHSQSAALCWHASFVDQLVGDTDHELARCGSHSVGLLCW